MVRPRRSLVALAIATGLLTSSIDAWMTASNTSTTASMSANSINNGIAPVNIGLGCSSSAPYPSTGATTQPRFSYVVTNPLAEFIALHFSDFNLPAGDYVLLRATNPTDREDNTYIYRGDETTGDFFSSALYTKSITIELYTTGDTQPMNVFQCLGFVVDSYRFLAQASSLEGSAQEEVCGADDSREAACFRSTPEAFSKADAVVRLLTHKAEGSFFCTGWLVGCEGHILTNNHCISSQAHASNTEFEFRAQGDSCSTSCSRPLGCRGSIRARSARLIANSKPLDYGLVQLDINLSNDYGYLQLRETGAVLNERIYIPQHPSGWGKRIAMKDDNGWGRVESLTRGGCATNQVAYSLDTRGGSSGSPVIAWSDHAVVALHHCGGCPNTAININRIVADFRARNVLPKCAIYEPPTPTPVTDAPTAAPTAPPTQSPTPPPQRPRQQTRVDGTIMSTATTTSIDYVDFTLAENADVELDILSMEATDTGGFADVNNDCNAGYIDSSIVIFRLNGDGSVSRAIAANDNAPQGYGRGDGSVSQSDSYMFLPLTAGRYRVAVGPSPMTVEQAAAKSMPLSTSPRICNARLSNYGNYRLTIASVSSVQVTGPGSYIGSQCSASNTVRPYARCSYHTEGTLTRAVTVDGTIVRQGGRTSVDHIPFVVNTFGRVTIDVSSYESRDGFTFIDVNGDCVSSYIDPIAYLFRRTAPGTAVTANDLVNAGDDDESFALRKNRLAISFRDPYISLALPVGEYILVVGRYPLSVRDAINRANTASPDGFTPETCGKKTDRGNYMVTFGSSQNLGVTSPNTYQGAKCPANVGKTVCVAS